MRKSIILIIGLMASIAISCQSKAEKAKKHLIEERISALKTIIITDSISEKENSKGDSILGVWEVNNEYYKAVFEIVKYKKQYFGKVHYFKDNSKEIKGKNSKEDYFIDGFSFEKGTYQLTKMHLWDGSHYQVKFLLNGDELIAQMTVQGEPYQEVWKRKKS